jgi:hypothetical protein
VTVNEDGSKLYFINNLLNLDTSNICCRDVNFPEQCEVTSKDSDEDSEVDDQGSASESSGSKTAELEEGISGANSDLC